MPMEEQGWNVACSPTPLFFLQHLGTSIQNPDRSGCAPVISAFRTQVPASLGYVVRTCLKNKENLNPKRAHMACSVPRGPWFSQSLILFSSPPPYHRS
jgi:hypothetical protein